MAKAKRMKNRELIKILAKKDWEAGVTVREEGVETDHEIVSISSFTKGGKPRITLNIASIE